MNVSFNNKPFRPTKIRKLHCQFGPHYYKAKERKTERILVQTTRKRDCPAMIIYGITTSFLEGYPFR